MEIVRTVTEVEVRSAPTFASPSTADHWSDLLLALAGRLDRGLIYDRDVRKLLPAMTVLIGSFDRRAR
ncbi:hypothetical protein [Oryzobacter terrae]|uniref:hypothetical protein n=1 Tax=Oryzobacter terrae TaxID=1620385 RepID=UPI00366B052E